MMRSASMPTGVRAFRLGWLLALVLGAKPGTLLAIIEEGSAAPAWELADLSEKIHKSDALAGRIQLLVFGEAHHPNTIEALEDLGKILKDLPADAPAIRHFLIAASSDSPQRISALLAEARLPLEPAVLLDRKRKAFEAYDVKVIPSAVLIGPDGKVALAVSGYPFDFEDLFADGILRALQPGERLPAGKAAGSPGTAQRSDREIEALRLLRLARGFERRGFLELGRQKFLEALERDPHLLEARLGLASIDFALGNLQESEERYRKIIDETPGLSRAELGLARIEIRRGQLDSAWDRVRKLAALTPRDPACHYLLGQIHEGRGEKEAALAAYKKAAGLLLAEKEPR